jgi:DNA repair photolyase
VLKKAKEAGIPIGVVAAPVITRGGWREDLERLFRALAELKPDVVFGESLHARGLNLARLKAAGVEAQTGPAADREVGRVFEELLREHGLRGSYWYEHRERRLLESGESSAPQPAWLSSLATSPQWDKPWVKFLFFRVATRSSLTC